MAPDAKIGDVLPLFPADAALSRFMEALEHVQTNVQIAAQSYAALLDAAEKSADARKTLSYFVVTASVGLITAYFSLMGKADPVLDVMRHYIPAVGIAICYIVMLIDNTRYREECRYTAQALQIEFDKKITNGAAATRATVLQYDSYWMPSRGHLASFCTTIPWLVIAVVEAWYSI